MDILKGNRIAHNCTHMLHLTIEQTNIKINFIIITLRF